MMTFLKVDGIETYIGQYHILHGVSFEVTKGEITVLLGRNGVGKTTTLRSIMGMNPIKKGAIFYKGERIDQLPTYEISNKGIGFVPEDQGVFPNLTVEENMNIAMKNRDEETWKRLEWILELFPHLKQFWKKKGGYLSGGQKQMLSIARAFVNDNELLLVDEPSKGLAPIIVEKVMESLVEIRKKATVVLVEQNFVMASEIGEKYYIIDDGRTVHSGEMADLKEDKDLRKQYLGIA